MPEEKVFVFKLYSDVQEEDIADGILIPEGKIEIIEKDFVFAKGIEKAIVDFAIHNGFHEQDFDYREMNEGFRVLLRNNYNGIIAKYDVKQQ